MDSIFSKGHKDDSKSQFKNGLSSQESKNERQEKDSLQENQNSNIIFSFSVGAGETMW